MAVTLVAGPPCAGKTTYVDERAEPGALVACHDRFAIAAGSPISHVHHRSYRDQAERQMASAFTAIAGGQYDGDAWVIRSLPRAHDRDEIARRLGVTRVVLLLPGRNVLLERAQRRPDVAATVARIDRWLALHAADSTA